ncbi:hypothetical protein L1887_28888 [Cichorium endivia]|nr:hypothetical protein L1887_28888 [Cichorium endivia]
MKRCRGCGRCPTGVSSCILLFIYVGWIRVSFTEFFAEEAHRIYGDIIPSTLSDHLFFILKAVWLLQFDGNPELLGHEPRQPRILHVYSRRPRGAKMENG